MARRLSPPDFSPLFQTPQRKRFRGWKVAFAMLVVYRERFYRLAARSRRKPRTSSSCRQQPAAST